MADVNPYDSIVASMPAPGANPYDAVVANLASSSGAKASLVAAQGSNPDATARALKVSAGLGVPVDVAERNLADFEAIDKVNQYDAVLRSSPAMLKRWLAEPVNARLVGDDLPVLAGQASLWRGLADIGRSAASGVVGFAGSALTGTGEAYDVAARTVGRIADGVGLPSTGVALPWYLDPAQILKRPGRTIKAYADEMGVPRERENLVDQVAQGVGQIGGQLAALMATGGAGGLLLLFGQGVDQMADDVQKSGKAGTIAGDATLIGGGMLTAIAEKTGLDLLVNRLPPAIRNKLARTVVDLAAAGGIEAAEEAIEKIGQNALSNYYLGTHKSLLDGTLDAAIPAGGAAAVVRGMLLGGGRLRRRQIPDPEQPAADAAALDQVMETARGSGLATRSPQKLAELLASMGDSGNVYVPADAVRTYFQNLDPQEAQQQARALGIDGQIEQAMATGGDVVIPLHQYVAHAPDEMAAAWHDDLRLRSAGMSINEAKTFKEGAKNLGDAVATRLDETSREDAAREEVVATVERQLQAAGESPEAARQIAQLYGARYATRATRLGQGDAVSQYGRSGVSVRSDLPEVIRHAPADDIELLIRALKGKRAGGVDDRKGPTILQFIAREGGIIDDAGELASRDLGKWHIGKPFQRKALREAPQPKGGGLPGLAPGAGDRSYYDADAWALRLWENGYFPEHTERPEVGDLYEAIDQELRGKPRYVEQQGRTWQSDFNAVLAEADELLNRAGIDARKASAEEIRKAFTDPEGQAYEQPAGDGTPRGNIVFSKDEEGRTRSLITLFKDRNLSTVLHETGHLWTEELLADAALPNAPEQIRADAATLRAYLGAEGDAPLTVEQHEKMARTVEAYFMEGKSPSVALSAVLARFKAWMMSIYKTIRGLEVEINDDIRGVLDRMIATDEAIAEAQTEIHARQLFASADQAGMTEAEYQAYTESVARSRDVAEHDVLAKLMDDVRRKLTAQWKAETDALREDVQPTVDTQPDILALRYLRDGTLPDSLAHLRELPRLRLSREALIEEYGNPEIVNALPKSVPPLTVDKGGVRPAEIAELLGFRDGRSMIDALTALAKEQDALKQAGDKRSVRAKRTDDEVDRVMIERHGPVLTDGSIEAEALSALHNDARADVLAAELRALARKAGKDAPPYKLARDWARRTIAEKAVGEISDLSQYTRAESRAGFAALEAATKGDADEALRRKQEQMIAHALWMEARDAKERVETARRKMDRLAGARTLKAMDQDYLEKIHALLERFDLKPRSMRDVERAESLRQWAEAQQIAGIDVAVPEKLLDEAYRTNYRRMTVEEFQGLSDSVDQLAHLGRMKQKFLDHKEQREFDEVVEEAVDAAGQGRQSGDTTTDIGKTNFQRRFGAVASRLRSADAALLKVEYLFNWLDGEKAGPFTRLFQRMSDAQAGEKTQWTDIGSKLRAIFHELPVETRRRLQDVAVYPELNGESLRRDALIAVALNMGNESNKEKMLKGHKWTEDGVLRAIDRGLGKEEMAFVQKTWDLIETLWPQIAAMERRVNGVAPEKVERSELVTRHGTFKGGYYPMVYEPKREAQKGDRTDALTAENFGSEVYTRATTPKGFTKQRVEGFNRPVHLSLEVIPQHLMEVVHDLHWREPIMAAQRFLNDARIKNAIRQKMGREYEAQLQPWLNHMALEYARDRQGMAGWDRFMKGLRTNMTMVGMGYRLTTIFSQIGGFSDATAELGTRWMASGFKAYAAHPIDSITFVRDRSGEMRHRADTLDRDIRKATREMVGQDSVLDPVRDFAFKGVAWADAAVTIPTWLGGYNKALHEGKTEAEAVQYADSMVRRSQGASGSKDMVRLQTSGEAGKLITMFYSYFSHYYNAQRDVARRFIDAESPGDFADALARAFWLNGPGVLAAGLLAGQGPGEDESWAAWAARTMFFNLFMGVPIARDIASEVSNAVAGKFVGGYQLSPVSRVLDTGVRVGFDAANLIQGDPATRVVSHTINLMGYLTALPTGQAATTMQFLYDALWSGSARPEGVTDWLKGVVYGSPPKK